MIANYLRECGTKKARDRPRAVRKQQEECILQNGIDGIAKWCKDNGMVLSTTECAVWIMKNLPPPTPAYSINGDQLPVVLSTRDLGVVISADLDFGEHISELVTSARTLQKLYFQMFCRQIA